MSSDKYELIIAEKPAAAQKIAIALSSNPSKTVNDSVPVYTFTYNGKVIKVTSAVGHIYTVSQNENTYGYPIYDMKWVPSYESNKELDYVKKYIKNIVSLSKNAESYTIATDNDIEGDVIGYNIIRMACKKKDANRMIFSTLTKNDLKKAYDTKRPTLSWGNTKAGIARHELDWLYGINLSRALMSSYHSAGGKKTLSSGRVQGPALNLIVSKEDTISKFVPEPYWQIRADLDKNIESWYSHGTHKFLENEPKDRFIREEDATKIYSLIKNEKNSTVDSVVVEESKRQPPHPFDLTSLQSEAHAKLGLAPKVTQDIAQILYTDALISYPRTSSQVLPAQIGYEDIISNLGQQERYVESVESLLIMEKLEPNNGLKTDPAHTAIYPTGNVPKDWADQSHGRLYDLIVRRFMATFGEPAVKEKQTITFRIKDERFVSSGIRTVKEGWYTLYGPYSDKNDDTFPKLVEGDIVPIKKIENMKKMTQPPKRYTVTSVIKELEKRNLGTKSTRAAIIENLDKRGYIVVNKNNIVATDLGKKTCEILVKYISSITDEAMTRSFEEKMDKIVTSEYKPEDVITEAKKILDGVLDAFKKQEINIGKELMEAMGEEPKMRLVINVLDSCHVCENGDLSMRNGKFGAFIGCNRYPECKTIYNIPETINDVSRSEEICICGFRKIQSITGTSTSIHCFNPACEKCEFKPHNMVDKCECGGLLLMREGKNGKFVGCNKYPECKVIYNLPKSKSDIVASDQKCPTCDGTMVMIDNKPYCPKMCKGLDTCDECKTGQLSIRKGKFGYFVGCNQYPNCKNVINVNSVEEPVVGKIPCEICKGVVINGKDKSKKKTVLCLNKNCGSKIKCKLCGKTMVERKSLKGAFYGCTGYPQCKGVIQK